MKAKWMAKTEKEKESHIYFRIVEWKENEGKIWGFSMKDDIITNKNMSKER